MSVSKNSIRQFALHSLLLLFLLQIAKPVHACDACSCFFGITPYDNQSHIGLIYRYRAFSGYESLVMNSDFLPDGYPKNGNGNTIQHNDHNSQAKSKNDYEIYSTLQINARYFLSQRFELNAQIPYRFNSQKYGNNKSSVKGIGDISLLVAYHIIKKINPDKMQHRLIGGAGIKLPTGNYNSVQNEFRIDPMLQPGTGTLDYFIYANYITAVNRFGLNDNVSYRINTTNAYEERMANAVTVNGSLFAKFHSGNLNHSFIPKVICYYEYSNGMYMNKEQMPGSEMNVLLIGPQLDYFYKNIMLYCNFQLPVYENQNPDYLSNAGSWSAGVIFNFKQTKFAF